MTPGRPARAAALAAGVLLAAAVVVEVREVATGRREAADADAAAARLDWPDAIAHARAAAEALAPGSPWPERGCLRLETIAHDAAARGDDATALAAYGAMHAAAMATRAPGSGSARWRAEAEQGLARLVPAGRDREATLDALRLGDDETPSTWTLGLLGGATAALLCIGYLASQRLML